MRHDTPPRKYDASLDARLNAGKQGGISSLHAHELGIAKNTDFLRESDPVRLAITLGSWFREGISGTNSFTPRLVLPSGSASFNSVSNEGFLMPYSGLIIGAFLNASATRTTGSAGLSIKINGTIVQTIDECAIDGTGVSNRKGSWYARSGGIVFGENDEIVPNFELTSWAPSCNFLCSLIVVFDET